MGDLYNILDVIRENFKSGKTKDIDFRIKQLKLLKKVIKDNEEDILESLNKDLNKSAFEGYATEIGIVYEEINEHIKHLRSWSKVKKVKSSIVYFKSKSYIYREPYGVVLIIGPFNYPFQLIMAPLIGAISAGNCAVIKPSESASNTALLLEKIINNNFESNYLRLVKPLEGKEVVSELLSMKFDYIFFTGSVKVGKIVMKKASENLTPITLELGGKSPCIIDEDANLEMAAKRIVWGKLLNAGQTCVAPDYLLVNSAIKDKLLKLIVEEIKKQYGEDIKNNPEYPKIIKECDVIRLKNYFKDGKIYFGGKYDEIERYVMPTILTDVDLNSEVMKNEIFGPILPVIEFNNINEAIEFITSREKPLALYYFSESKNNIEYIINNTTAGGVTINDTVIHVASTKLPFGGVGQSGMGSYHGKASFDTFTHNKSVVKRATFIEFPVRFAPFKDKIKLLRKFIK